MTHQGPHTADKSLWAYVVLPAVILNVGGCTVFGVYYGLAARQPGLMPGLELRQVLFALYMFISIVEWAFALLVLRWARRAGLSLRRLIVPGGDGWGFRWGPAASVFAAFNVTFAIYVLVYEQLLGGWPRFADWPTWQRVILVSLVPATAGFCEELIWRGHIIPRLEARGWRPRSAVLLSAISFALIHGIFLPDKLLVTFLLGVAAGLYYVRERNLVPLMVSHTVVDLWSFALSALGP